MPSCGFRRGSRPPRTSSLNRPVPAVQIHSGSDRARERSPRSGGSRADLPLRMNPMKCCCLLLLASSLLSGVRAQAQDVKRDIPYGDRERQVLDVYAPPGARSRPVVFWIHGGGWEGGNKADVAQKPRAFV